MDSMIEIKHSCSIIYGLRGDTDGNKMIRKIRLMRKLYLSRKGNLVKVGRYYEERVGGWNLYSAW